MKHEVCLTHSAESDLAEIYDYIAHADSQKKADYVLENLVVLTESLAKIPERGTYPKELQEIGIYEYRQAFFKPYRLIYRIINQKVFIYLIVDGRRDIESVLTRRLLQK